MEALYQKYFNESSTASILVEVYKNADGSISEIRVLDLNKAFCKQFSVPSQNVEVLDDCFVNAYTSISEKVHRTLNLGRKNLKVFVGDTNESYEVTVISVEGNIHLIEFSNVTEEVEDLRLVLIEQALEKSQKKYQMLFGAMKNLFVSLKLFFQNGELDDIIVNDVNPSFEKLIGKGKDELLGLSVKEMPFFQPTNLIDKVENLIETKSSKHFLLSNNDLRINLDASLYMVDDNTIGFIANDITEQLKVEIALKASEERYRSLLETADDRIAVFAEDMELKYANPAYYTKLGYTKDDYPKEKQDILNLFTNPQLILDFLETLRVEEHAQLEYNVRHKDGSILTMYAYFQTMNTDVEDKEVLVISRDITDLKQNEIRLLEAKEKAEESDRLKSSFLANMSHEIRTPLNGILGFSRLLSRPNLTEEKKNHYINLIDTNGNHLLSIISDILDIAKIESNQLEVSFEKVNLNELFDSLLEISNTIIQKKEIGNLAVSVSKGLATSNAYIETDPMRLMQIMRNLIENALKFTEDGSVNFGYKEYGANELYFYVKDTGIGIGEEGLNVVFQHFRQEDETITRRFGGTGLGLSICKHLVQHLGGTIGVESEKGVGSTFYFTLPYKKIEVPQNLPVIEENDSSSTSSRDVVIGACISEEMMTHLQSIFDKTNVSIVSFESFDALVANCSPDILQAAMIDMTQSKIEASGALQQIKDKLPYMPVFGSFNEVIENDKVFYTQMGFNDIFDLNTDGNKINSVLSFYFEL